jgi:sec-independent protein translocase protein TatB
VLERRVLDLSLPKIAVLAVLALVIFGPDQLPKIAAQAGRALRDLRRIAENAKTDLQDGLGPEFRDFDINDLHPRTFVRKHLLDDLDRAGGRHGGGRRGRRGAGARRESALRHRGHLTRSQLTRSQLTRSQLTRSQLTAGLHRCLSSIPAQTRLPQRIHVISGSSPLTAHPATGAPHDEAGRIVAPWQSIA